MAIGTKNINIRASRRKLENEEMNHGSSACCMRDDGRCILSGRDVQAGEMETDTYIGLDAEYHTQDEIREYYKNHPIRNMEAEFVTESSVTASYDLGELTEEAKQDALNMLNLYWYIAGIPLVSITSKIKVPAKKLPAYKRLFKNKGQGRKVKIVK